MLPKTFRRVNANTTKKAPVRGGGAPTPTPRKRKTPIASSAYKEPGKPPVYNPMTGPSGKPIKPRKLLNLGPRTKRASMG